MACCTKEAESDPLAFHLPDESAKTAICVVFVLLKAFRGARELTERDARAEDFKSSETVVTL